MRIFSTIGYAFLINLAAFAFGRGIDAHAITTPSSNQNLTYVEWKASSPISVNAHVAITPAGELVIAFSAQANQGPTATFYYDVGYHILDIKGLLSDFSPSQIQALPDDEVVKEMASRRQYIPAKAVEEFEVIGMAKNILADPHSRNQLTEYIQFAIETIAVRATYPLRAKTVRFSQLLVGNEAAPTQQFDLFDWGKELVSDIADAGATVKKVAKKAAGKIASKVFVVVEVYDTAKAWIFPEEVLSECLPPTRIYNPIPPGCRGVPMGVPGSLDPAGLFWGLVEYCTELIPGI